MYRRYVVLYNVQRLDCSISSLFFIFDVLSCIPSNTQNILHIFNSSSNISNYRPLCSPVDVNLYQNEPNLKPSVECCYEASLQLFSQTYRCPNRAFWQLLLLFQDCDLKTPQIYLPTCWKQRSVWDAEFMPQALGVVSVPEFLWKLKDFGKMHASRLGT